MASKTNKTLLIVGLIVAVALLIPWHKVMLFTLNLTNNKPIIFSNIYILPTEEWNVLKVPSSININHNTKLIGISIIKTIRKSDLEKFVKYNDKNNINYVRKKYKVGDKIVDGIEDNDKVDKVMYKNIKIILKDDVLLTIFYSREDKDVNLKIVESFLRHNIRVYRDGNHLTVHP